jgi:hypothetical protein
VPGLVTERKQETITPGVAAAAWAETKPHGIPAVTPKRFFPFTL